MKKILYLLVTIFMFSIFKFNVYASSFSIVLDGEDSFDDEISIDIIVNNISDFTNGFYGLDATLSYDKTKLELKEITKPESYELIYDKDVSDRFVVLPNEGVGNNTILATMTFKNKGLSADESATITLTNLIGSDSENDITTSDVSKTITLGSAPQYQKGDMNKDGRIGLQDVIDLLKKYLGLEEITAEDIQIGDMNNDGNISLQDVISLLKIYLGIN